MGYVILFVIIILIFVVAIFAFYSLLAYFVGVPYVPTLNMTMERMLELAEIKPRQKIADLGSGDGRLLIVAARKGAQAVGWEINPILAILSKIKIRHAGLQDKITIHVESYWPADLKKFDVIFLFLIPNKMEQMEQKLRRELKPGAKVISNSFVFPNWQYSKKLGEVYLYEIDSKLKI